MASKYRNAGQTCVCANRILVQAGIYDRFAAGLVEAVKKLTVGPGTEAGVAIGPLINEEAIAKVETLVGDAVKRGAKILVGGGLDAAGPLFYQPSVVGDVAPDMEIVREEIFGPVAALERFDTEADAIRLANDTPFGLAAYLFSQNLSRAWRVAEKLDAGMVGINEGIFSNEVVPFGGIKESGLGREGAAEGLEEYLETKYICLGAIDA
jgi:succinate-semialdehyde dehydrogenase/glutarate-semialdehyde dehydrogenase